MGPVDNPRRPCRKCKREAKDCVIDTTPRTRKKRKLSQQDDEDSESDWEEEEQIADDSIGSAKKRRHSELDTGVQASTVTSSVPMSRAESSNVSIVTNPDSFTDMMNTH